MSRSPSHGTTMTPAWPPLSPASHFSTSLSFRDHVFQKPSWKWHMAVLSRVHARLHSRDVSRADPSLSPVGGYGPPRANLSPGDPRACKLPCKCCYPTMLKRLGQPVCSTSRQTEQLALHFHVDFRVVSALFSRKKKVQQELKRVLNARPPTSWFPIPLCHSTSIHRQVP